jgi:hypothetical protein
MGLPVHAAGPHKSLISVSGAYVFKYRAGIVSASQAFM